MTAQMDADFRTIRNSSKCPAAMLKPETECYVNGHRLGELLYKAYASEADMATKVGFISEQSLRNYVGSTPRHPWKASLKKVRQLAEELGVDCGQLILDITVPPVDSLQRAIDAVEKRFMGDAKTCRSIAGIWDCTSEDVPIPGKLDYTHTIPWTARAEKTQTGSLFEAQGVDKDEDLIFARGALLENGNFVRFTYFVEHPRLRQHGTGLLEFKGDGKTMEGYLPGRSAAARRHATGQSLANATHSPTYPGNG